ncbi:MAG: metallophosphoesterase family protein [Deltaproteobacteria bacterium]|nr:metallophosphoesterase family protein [Deltaproteobacteria bacterium]
MARFGVIADPHGNLSALDAVLRALDEWRVDGLVCAGDLVGYNAEPDAVASLLCREAFCVAGNHDRIATGALDERRAWEGARRALVRTRGVITEVTRARLAELPTLRVIDGGILVFHGTLGDVTRRILTPGDVLTSAHALRDSSLTPRLVVFGHTHVPSVHRVIAAGDRTRVVRVAPHQRIALTAGGTWFLNPGSVDGARRGEGCASFAIVDTAAREISFGAARYDHRGSERRARASGYRSALIERGRLALSSHARALVSRGWGTLARHVRPPLRHGDAADPGDAAGDGVGRVR